MTNPITLADNVNLHIIPTDKFTTNIFCVLIRQPLRRNTVTETAILPALLSRGSARYPSVRDIRLAAESLKGSIFDAQIIKKGEQQILQFFLEFVDGDIAFREQGLNFLSEVIRQPRIESGGFFLPYVSGESENLKNRIEGRINNKSEYAKLKCLEIMCHDEPFGLYGDGYAEDLPYMTPIGLFDHYNKIWDTSPIDFIALGRWSGYDAWLKEKITAKFAQLLERDVKTPKTGMRSARSDYALVQLDHGGSQGNLCIGLRGEISPLGMDFIHFQLVNEILGGGPNAKLFTNVREKESLCYSIYSIIYRFKSIMCIMAGTEPDKMEHVLELADREVSSLKQGNFSARDLDNARQSLSKRWRAMQDNPSACVDFYASQYLLEDPHTVDELLLQVKAATAEGVAHAACCLDIDTVVMMR